MPGVPVGGTGVVASGERLTESDSGGVTVSVGRTMNVFETVNGAVGQNVGAPQTASRISQKAVVWPSKTLSELMTLAGAVRSSKTQSFK
jgi:hypothetical protein